MTETAESDNKPRLFISSSVEGRNVADAIQHGLIPDIEAEVWHQDIFKLTDVPLDSLESAVRTNDFAVIVVTPDDVTTKRGKTHVVPRDNLVFEIGMFVGALGRRRTFIVIPVDEEVSLPTNLSGLTVARYNRRSDDNWIAAVGPACLQVKTAMERAIRDEGSVVVHRSATAARPPERRMHQRALGVAQARDRDKEHRIADISVSGAFLETDSPIRLGAVLDLSLDLDLDFHDSTSARVTAEVVRVQEPGWLKPGGVGVKFVHCSKKSKSMIGRYIKKAEAARRTV